MVVGPRVVGQVAEALERDSHTGDWLSGFRRAGAQVFEHQVPPRPERRATRPTKSAVLNPPGEAGVELSNWNWKVVRQFLKQAFRSVGAAA